MCTYNISIDDAVMEKVRPSITKGMSEATWVQLQVEMLFSQLAMPRSAARFDDNYMSNLIRQSASAWKDVDNADKWIHELRGE